MAEVRLKAKQEEIKAVTTSVALTATGTSSKTHIGQHEGNLLMLKFHIGTLARENHYYSEFTNNTVKYGST
jgi:hypothetical protein